jgi:hypothetical protein
MIHLTVGKTPNQPHPCGVARSPKIVSAGTKPSNYIAMIHLTIGQFDIRLTHAK